VFAVGLHPLLRRRSTEFWRAAADFLELGGLRISRVRQAPPGSGLAAGPKLEDEGEDDGVHRDDDGGPASRIYGFGDRRLPGCHGAGSNPRPEAEQRQRRATDGSCSSPELGSRRASL
jgi:hypothetical protein